MHLGYNLHVPGVEPGHSMISRQGCIHGDDDEIRFWQLARQIRADIRLSSLDGGGELWGIYRAIELFSSRALFKSATPLSLFLRFNRFTSLLIFLVLYLYIMDKLSGLASKLGGKNQNHQKGSSSGGSAGGSNQQEDYLDKGTFQTPSDHRQLDAD